jgi:hypothetical protein
MKRLSLGALAAFGLLASSCTTTAYENNHWHINHIAPRVSYHFFGYRPSVDGAYHEKLWSDIGDMGVTLRRHFINDNPDNPLLAHPTLPPYRPQPPQNEFQVGK